MIHPVTNRPEHKRSFIPSLIEKEKVSKMVHAIKMGWIKPRRVEDDSRGRYYDLWANEDSSILAKHRMHLPAPKIPLPGHHESYNPPPEYLFTEEEVGRLSVCPPVSAPLVFTRPSACLPLCSELCGSSRIRRTGSSRSSPGGSRASAKSPRSLASFTRGSSAASTSTCVPGRGR